MNCIELPVSDGSDTERLVCGIEVYHPAGFARKHDRSGAFRRKFLRASAGGGRGKGQKAARDEDSEMDRGFTARSDALKAAMQRAYLDAPAGFLRLLQQNVLKEWQGEDPGFAKDLAAAVARAKKEACHDCRAYAKARLGRPEFAGPPLMLNANSKRDVIASSTRPPSIATAYPTTDRPPEEKRRKKRWQVREP